MYKRYQYLIVFICLILFFLAFGAECQAATTGGTSLSNAALITSASTDIILNDGSATPGRGYFKFIPAQSGTLIITTSPNTVDTEAILYYDATGSSSKQADYDDYTDVEFYLTTGTLDANQTYYLYIKNFDNSQITNCTLSITGGNLRGNNAPTISITNPGTNLLYKDSQTINISGSVNDSDGDNITVTATISGQTATTTVNSGSGTWTLSWNTTSISESTYNGIVFTANDGLGGTSTATYTGNIVVDKTAPTATTVTYSKNPVKQGDSLTITANFSEPLLDSPIVKIAISGANTVAATNMTKVNATQYIYTYTVAAGDGAATVSFSVGTDAAGNVVTATPTSGASYTIDSTGPAAPTILALASQPETAWHDGYLNTSDVASNRTLRVALSTSGNLAIAGDTLYVYSDGSQIGSKLLDSTDITYGYIDVNIVSATLGGLTETTHTLTARIIDSVGNTGSASAGVSIIVDKTAPTATTVTYSKNPVKQGDSLTITANFSEPLLDSPIVKIAISGANAITAANMTKVNATQYTYTYTVAAGDGAATVSFSAGTDAAGNVVTATPTSGTNYIIDNKAPVPSFNPADNALDVVVTSNLVITFDEAVTASGEGVTIYKSDSSDTVKFTMTGSGTNTITINPMNNLAGATDYYVLIQSTAFHDAAGNYYGGITAETGWNFKTATVSAPTIIINRPTAGTEYDINTGSMVIATFTDNGTGINEDNVTIQIDGGTPVKPTKLVPNDGIYKLYHVITGVNYGTANNSHTITVTIKDSADKVLASQSVTFTMKPKRKGFGFGRLRFD
jgi:hypothetical protein